MTAKRVRLNECRGKHGHTDKDAAMSHLMHLVRGGAAKRRLTVYQCSTCRQWHVGHRPKPRKAR